MRNPITNTIEGYCTRYFGIPDCSGVNTTGSHLAIGTNERTPECRCLRIPISDMEGEDIGAYFDAAQRFIDGAAASGGAALVHCHEGKSRSVTLVLAYFMKTKVQGNYYNLPVSIHV